jgi:hypothetical protein
MRLLWTCLDVIIKTELADTTFIMYSSYFTDVGTTEHRVLLSS